MCKLALSRRQVNAHRRRGVDEGFLDARAQLSSLVGRMVGRSVGPASAAPTTPQHASYICRARPTVGAIALLLLGLNLRSGKKGPLCTEQQPPASNWAESVFFASRKRYGRTSRRLFFSASPRHRAAACTAAREEAAAAAADEASPPAACGGISMRARGG